MVGEDGGLGAWEDPVEVIDDHFGAEDFCLAILELQCDVLFRFVHLDPQFLILFKLENLAHRHPSQFSSLLI